MFASQHLLPYVTLAKSANTSLQMTVCERLLHAFITSSLDSCNSVLIGLPRSTELDKLQHIQNCATRILTGTKKHGFITPVLCKLHWLPVHFRVKYQNTSYNLQSFIWTCTYLYFWSVKVLPAVYGPLASNVDVLRGSSCASSPGGGNRVMNS